jgi:hypothetical protein
LRGIETTDLLQDREAIHPRQFQIQDHDIRVSSTINFQTLLPTVSNDDVISLPSEERVEEVPDTMLIINHQNFGHGSLPEEIEYVGPQ